MITIYWLFIVMIPIGLLWNARFVNEKSELLTKEDSYAMRGIAAIFVVASHYMMQIQESGSVAVNSLFYLMISQLGGVGVLIFFFISGYGNYDSYINRQPAFCYVIKRIEKVYFPYLIIRFVLLIFESLFKGRECISFSRILKIIFVQDWFVQVILLEYLFFYLGWKFVAQKYFFLYQLFINVIVSSCFIGLGFNARYYNSMWLFVIGMLCSLYKDRISHYYIRNSSIIFVGGGYSFYSDRVYSKWLLVFNLQRKHMECSI